MMDLRGHAAFITGGTQGVGAAIAKYLAQCGANLVLHGLLDDELAEETVAACRSRGVQVQTLFCDLWQPISSLESELFVKAVHLVPEIDLLVNNAGIFIDRPFLEMDEERFDRTLHLNLKVGYFLTLYFSKLWIKNHVRGRVLFTGSINGLLAEADHTAYDASKGAVASLVRSLCVALAPHGIRVNSMAPGLVRTPLTNQVLDKDAEALRWMELHTPNGSVPKAEVCGPLAAFLLSDLADHIHGQTMYIDGGMSAWQQPNLPPSLRDKL